MFSHLFEKHTMLMASLFWGLYLCLPGAAIAQQQCPVERVCPNTCCAAGSICYQQQCITAGKACTNNGDCAAGSFCAIKLQQCLKASNTNATCTYRPPIGKFSPAPLWEWRGGTVMSNYKQVMMTPVVMALQDDNKDGSIDVKDTPSVIFISHVGGGSHAEEGILRAVRGDNGKAIFTVTDSRYRVNGLGSLAVGDIDNDGKPDIIAPRFAGRNVWAGGLYAFDNTGKLKWVSKNAAGQIVPLVVGWGGAAIADLDGDGKPEVVVGSAVVRGSDGLVLCQGASGAGSNDARRPLSTIADIDGDGKQEIVTGRYAYRHDCKVMWNNNQSDGYPAVADFNGDGQPEVAVVSGSTLRLQNGLTGKVLMTTAITGGGGGPPTISDFNGDGKPDIALAGSNYYIVYTPNFTTNTFKTLWSFKTRDFSSGRTGSSIFDFENDGKAEAVYNDERFMRVFNGTTGGVLFSSANNSSTSLEYPVIVDVNNDGRAEIVVSSNHGSMANIRVFRDRLDNWVNTRNIWNQHAYHVTNICTGPKDPFCPPGTGFGQVPKKPLQHWKVKGLNSFRQNVQGKGLFEAADLMLRDIRASWFGCTDRVEIGVWVFNQGAKQIPKDIPVTLYQGTAASKTKLTTLKTTRPLEPGEGEWLKTTVTIAKNQAQNLYIAVDDDGAGQSTRNECDEKNNHLSWPIPSAKGQEICDGKDNNCDGNVDETWPTVGNACSVGVGACKGTGKVVCKADGSGASCNAQPGAPSQEKCDNIDNDCDGNIDEQLNRPCQTACGSGNEQCNAGKWGPCDAKQPKTETCNNIDDDCDGNIDNNIPSRPCKSICGEGKETCKAGQWNCDATQPKKEECNGVDDNCDGKIDNDLPPKPCKHDCGQGTAICIAGKYEGCKGKQPEKEVCDGKDNDCDGRIDDNISRECKTDCGTGAETCTKGTWGECSAPSPQPELCDGKDNDCDGSTDEGAKCPGSAVCKDGRCLRKCRDSECPKGATCKVQPSGESLCEGDLCTNVKCPKDQRCLAGTCTDLCKLVTCPKGTICTQGTCTKEDCYTKGCPSGETCVSGQCTKDPCDGVSCNKDQFCRPDANGKGTCFDACGDKTCPAGEKCVDGQCTQDPCDGVTCPKGQSCQSGQCAKDPCANVSCVPGRICIDGLCQHDPCHNIKCPKGQECQKSQCVGNSGSDEPSVDAGTPDGNTADNAVSDTPTPEGTNKNTGQENQRGTDSQRYATGCGCQSSGHLPLSLGMMFLLLLFSTRRQHNS